MEEIWRDIPHYEGHYQVSNPGKSINKKYSLISTCCSGKVETAYGYRWEFAKGDD